MSSLLVGLGLFTFLGEMMLEIGNCLFKKIFFCLFFAFLGPYPGHMEVPMLGV